MDFDFSDDQVQLREAVARWVDKAYAFERRRQIVQEGGYSAEAYQEMAELGLAGLNVPIEHNGLGLGPIEAMVVMEELGRGLVLEPLSQTLMASLVLTAYAPADLQQNWLPALASGQTLIALAWQERAGRYRLDKCQTRAHAVAGGYRLDGHKHVVPAGDLAGAFVVSALLDGQLALFLVRADAGGLQRRAYGTQEGGRAADLALQATAATLITREGRAALSHALDLGTACACAEGVAVMERSLAITCDYMKQRQQFGVPISSFQALRHRVADMKMQLELGRSMSYYAWLKLGAPQAEREQAIARAKVQLGLAMRQVGQQSVQLHGGIGVTDEYIISHCFKKLTQLELSFGDTLHHLGEVCSRMQETAGVFA